MAHSPGDEPTRRAIAKALRSKEVRDGIAAAVARYAKAHIAKGEGRGPSGQAVALKPLKDLETEFWTLRKPKDASAILGTRQRTVQKVTKTKKGTKIRTVEVTEYRLKGTSYRAGGQPLRDTGNLVRNIGARAEYAGETKVEIILTGPLYAIFHELGFETSGPNYIPMSKKGKRQHATGNNPDSEGLTEGKDYIMAWNGVEVPARPFLVPTTKEWSDIGRTIRLGLKKILKGR